ncbi:MAG: alpha/beta hydrolase [Phaeovulum sp.]|uniref:alpha/beta fold hydrolase n=1 Tax=Phaeovulum sp. TaxID=2934796 RepID=UPI0027306836|nr:alpha/beta hydrolase [Phaeovulum sp.]MDP2062590.1 alpha/beta hydrolase [Phaeovulum sp.]
MPREIRAGHPTFWQVFGSGARPALAVHCTLAHSGAWAGVAARLPELAITAFDMPGHGQSAAWAGSDYQGDVTRIAASFIDRPIDLIGHSFGATVALRLAVAAPEAVRTLTLIEPVLFVAAAGTAEFAAQMADNVRLQALIDAGDTEAAARGFVGQWGAGLPWEKLDLNTRRAFVAQMPLVLAGGEATFADTAEVLRAGGLEGIDAPVMLIRGEKSPSIMAIICEAIAARLPDVGVAVMPGAGHMLPLTHAAGVAELIALNLSRA